jgi:hypothetical protein
MDCAAVGDIIAASVGQLLQCKQVSTNVVVISLGGASLADLRAMRATVSAKIVVWMVPYDQRAAQAVLQVAGEHRDAIVDLRFHPTLNGKTPASYPRLAREVELYLSLDGAAT